MKNELRHALQVSFSGLTLSQYEKAQIINSLEKKNVVVKKKISIGLAFAILAVFIAATALAVTHWEKVLSYVFQTEQDKGGVENWSYPDKVEFIALLSEAGIDMTDLPDMEEMDAREADSALTAWISEHFNGEVTSLHFTMLEQIKGPFDTWSVADKAWYSGLLLGAGVYQEGDDVFVSAERAVLKKEVAVEIAEKWLTDHEGLSETEINGWICCVSYYYIYPDTDTFYWRVNYRKPSVEQSGGIAGIAYGFYIEDKTNAQAQLYTRLLSDEEWAAITEADTLKNKALQKTVDDMQEAFGPMGDWPLEYKATIWPETYGLPTANEISEDYAVKLAIDTLASEYELDASWLESLHTIVFFVINDPGQRYYVINFVSPDDSLVPSVHVSGFGEILEVFEGGNG